MYRAGGKKVSGTVSKRPVLLGLSGGVDSMAAALLLKDNGYDVTAVTLWTWREDQSDQARIEAAARSSNLLGIPHRILDVRQAFYDRVVMPFVDGWKNGLTPNPCVLCNPAFKFAVLRDLADQLGCHYLATGHYARIEQRTSEGYRLSRASHRRHDQSYFLYRLASDLLGRILFPVGGLSKEEVRRLVHRFPDPVAEARDSQDICFIEKNQLRAFLGRRGLEEKRGYFINPSGDTIGEHKGSWHYTVGQRRHLGQSFGERMTVLAIDHLRNTVTLGPESDAFMSGLNLTDLILHHSFPVSFSCGVQLRSQGEPLDAVVSVEADASTATVRFAQPARVTSPGQSAVFYQDDYVLGGGVVAGMA